MFSPQGVKWCYLRTCFTTVEFIKDFLASVNNYMIFFYVVGLFNDMSFNDESCYNA